VLARYEGVRIEGDIVATTAFMDGDGGWGIIKWRCVHNSTRVPRAVNTWFKWDECVGPNGKVLRGAPERNQEVVFTLAPKPDGGLMAVNIEGTDGSAGVRAQVQPAPKRRRF